MFVFTQEGLWILLLVFQVSSSGVYSSEMADPATVHQTSASEEAEVLQIISGLEDAICVQDVPIPYNSMDEAARKELLVRYPWTQYFAAFSNPYSGYTTDLATAEALVRSYGLHMNTNYTLIKTSGTLRKQSKYFLGSGGWHVELDVWGGESFVWNWTVSNGLALVFHKVPQYRNGRRNVGIDD